MKPRQKTKIAIEMKLQLILLQSANTRTDKKRLSVAMYVNSTYIDQKTNLAWVSLMVNGGCTYVFV